MDDMYATLGVPSNASEAEIRTAYLERIRRAHPDVEGGDEEWAKQVTAAYTILSDPKSRQEYDQRIQGALCPFCGQDLRQVGDVDSHLYTHYVRVMADACEICGRKPTQIYDFKSNSGFILARQVWGFHGRLCGVCAEGMFKEFQTRNITRGPWGIFSFFAAIWYLISNATGYYSKKRQSPIPQDPEIDTELRGRSVFARPAVLLSLAIIGFVGFAVFGDLAASSGNPVDSANTPSQNTPTPTSPVVTQPPVVVEQPDWEIGTCVDFVGDMAEPARCSQTGVEGQIIDIVTDVDFCPAQTEWYVDLSFNEVVCIESR